jgi:hypothetical protein
MVVITTSCIPRNKEKFNNYVHSTNIYLGEGTPPNGKRLNIPEPHMVIWDGILTRWIGHYEKYLDKINSCTPAVINELNSIIDEAHNFDETTHFTARIAIADNATQTDFEMFHIPTGSGQKKGRTNQTPITDLVEMVLKPLGGASVSVKCYGKGSRAAILDGANGVQYRYMVGVAAPTSAADKMLDTDVSSKSTFVLATGASNVGLQLYIYFRWYHTKHPEIAGPWSRLQTVILL